MFVYNIVLCVYNTCAITFRMQEATIKKRVEPFLHFFAVGVGFVLASLPLFFDLYNPNGWEAWCIISNGSAGGYGDESSPPPRGKINIASSDEKVVIAMIAFTLVLILACFASMIRRVWQVERLLYGYSFRRQSRRLENARRCHKNTKIIIIQSSAYFGSFLLTLGCCLVRYLYDDALWVFRLQIVFLPLQGFFNALIFISIKVYNYRRTHEDHSICETLKMLFHGEADEVLIFSRISLIRQDLDARVMEIEVTDERSNKNMQIELDGSCDLETPSRALDWEDEESKLSQSNNDLSGFSTLLDGDGARGDLDSGNQHTSSQNLSSIGFDVPSKKNGLLSMGLHGEFNNFSTTSPSRSVDYE